MGGSNLFGWVAVLGAVVGYGSFGVPIKWNSVRDARVHPFVFQTYKSFWVFVTSWIVLAFKPFAFTWWGLASGLFWVPAGAAYVVAVEHAGIGITQATVSSLIITVATLWGTIFFEEHLKDPGLAALAFLLLLAGVTTMSYFSVPKAPPAAAPVAEDASRDSVASENAHPQHHSETLARPDSDSDMVAAPLHGDPEEPRREESRVPTARDGKSLWVGLAAASFNGIWGGSLMVPMKIAAKQGAVTGIDFVISFGLGVALVTAAMWVILAAWTAVSMHRRRKAANDPYDSLPDGGIRDDGGRPAVRHGAEHSSVLSNLPQLQLQVMALPGMLAGCTWALGNFSAMFATLELGEAVGYSSCQAAVMVSGAWGIFYFGEAPRGAFFFGLGALACTSGIVLLSMAS